MSNIEVSEVDSHTESELNEKSINAKFDYLQTEKERLEYVSSIDPKKMQQFSERELQRIARGLPPWESMSFACGGWLQFYMFGVGKALQCANLDKGVQYSGCSAGGLAAAGLALGGEFDDAVTFCNDYCLPEAYNNLSGLFRLTEYVAKCMARQLPNRFRPMQEGQLQIALTRLPFFTKERATVFETEDDLMTALLGSAAAFPFAKIVKRKGNWYIDGGLSDFQPIIDENTITVSPFYFSDCDIKPSRYVPLWWTFMPPKSSDTVEWLYNLGFEDCLQYIRSRGIPLDPNNASLKRVYEANAHPYYKPHRVSMHRFLGYDLNHITNNTFSFVMDFLLLVLLLVVWKPLALLLIYIELWVRIIVLSIFALVQIIMRQPIMRSMQRKCSEGYDSMTSYYIKLAKSKGYRQLAAFAESYKRYHSYNAVLHEQLWNCLACVGSLSLFLRFISGRPSSVELRKHDMLAKASVLYRVFRRII